MLSKKDLIKVIDRLHQRNIELGYHRFDTSDILSSEMFIWLQKRLPYSLIKLIRLPEVFFPIRFRNFFKVKKQLIPVSFFHLGNFAENYSKINASFKFDFNFLISNIVSCGNSSGYLCWEHPYPHHYLSYIEKMGVSNDLPASCAHHGARLTQFLLKYGKNHNDSGCVELGISGAKALLNYHNWKSNKGAVSVSYYPFTTDEVINTACEVALALLHLPKYETTPDIQQKIKGICQMVINEMNPDGSWFYSSTNHYRLSQETPIIDNSHTSMNLNALIEIIELNVDYLQDMRKQLIITLDKGLEFYVKKLYHSKNKIALNLPNKSQEATLSGYCESIFFLSKVCYSPSYKNLKINKELSDILDFFVKRILKKFVDTKTYDVASQVIFNLPINFQSHRVGSGLLLDALSTYIVRKHSL